MRKSGIIVAIYAVLALVVCFLISYFMKNVPVLLEGEQFNYILVRGFLYFCHFVPALVFSAFLLGCTIAFGKNAEKAKLKYSPQIMTLFKKTMICSILIVLGLSFVAEVFVPLFESRQARARVKPLLFSEFMNLSREYYDLGNMNLAFEYSYNALLLNPKDKNAIEINENAYAELNSLKMVLDRPLMEETQNKEEKVPVLFETEVKGETVTSLLTKAKKAMDEEKWFDAHYYSYLAIEVGGEKDINLETATRLASEAWNHLFDPSNVRESSRQDLFRKKREAYRSLIRGDNVEAYYQFLEISNYSDIAARDPDVVKFLAIASSRVENQFFFIEEFENLRRFEAYNNVYFAVPHSDGSRDIVYIRGITPVKNSGRMIQYLRGFTLFTYSKEGKFIRSMYVPYAKMLAERTSTFNDSSKAFFGIRDDFKTVPYLMLESISKGDRSGRISPVYEYDADYSQKNEPYLNSYFVLGLPVSDFNLLCDATSGSGKMSLLSLIKFLHKTRDYGYSYEVFNSDFVYRATYPLIMLICCIFLACMAWNYRLKNEQLFKFKWIFLLPLITFIQYFALDCGLYVCKVLNYALVILFGSWAVVVSVTILVLLFIIVCFNFLTRTAD